MQSSATCGAAASTSTIDLMKVCFRNGLQRPLLARSGFERGRDSYVMKRIVSVRYRLNPAPAPNDNDTPVAKALGVLSFGGFSLSQFRITPNMQGGVHLAGLGRWASAAPSQSDCKERLPSLSDLQPGLAPPSSCLTFAR